MSLFNQQTYVKALIFKRQLAGALAAQDVPARKRCGGKAICAAQRRAVGFPWGMVIFESPDPLAPLALDFCNLLLI
jgi:hypothetical protein